MATMVPNDGANYLLNLFKTDRTAGVWICLCTAMPADGATVGSGLNEVASPNGTPAGGSGTYNRIQCTQGNMSITTDTLTLSGNFDFTGFVNVTAITHIAVITGTNATDNTGKLVFAASLSSGLSRVLASASDTLRIASPTFQLTNA